MKHLYIFLIFILAFKVNAQTPQGISYQAVARDSSGYILKNTPLKVRFSIRDSIANGNIIYQETHFDTTDAIGLFDLVLGEGSPVINIFSNIKWGINKKFMQIEIDANSGIYISMGTQQMISVPYALYAESANSISSNFNPFKPFFLGQDTLDGIVYDLFFDSIGNVHGHLVSKEELYMQQWQNIISTTNAISIWDGKNNTNLITNSAIRQWVQNLGNSWFIPSQTELVKIFNNLNLVNTALEKRNLKTIDGMLPYWSSTEMSSNQACGYYGQMPGILTMMKTNRSNTRAIRTF